MTNNNKPLEDAEYNYANARRRSICMHHSAGRAQHGALCIARLAAANPGLKTRRQPAYLVLWLLLRVMVGWGGALRAAGQKQDRCRRADAFTGH